MFNQPQNAHKKPSHPSSQHKTTPFTRALIAGDRLQAHTVLRSEDILELQRTIGNRATLQLLEASAVHSVPERQVQRKLANARPLAKLAKKDPTLTNLSEAVGYYNEIADKRKTPEQFQTCFKRLQMVERAVYAWFDTVSQTHRQLSDRQDHDKVGLILGGVQREHRELVSESKHLVDVLPFDTGGLSPTEIAEMKKLWQEIANNQGKIKLIGSEKYNQRVLSELGHILSTPTGRALLSVLNTPPATEQAGTPEADLTNIYIGEIKSQLPRGVQEASSSLEDLPISVAQPLDVGAVDPTHAPKTLTDVTKRPINLSALPDEQNYPPATADSLFNVRNAAWGGKKGFTNQGMQYDFNKKVGAFVTSYPGQALNPAKGTNNEILTPGWVTLGHELGHAANMRSGATTIDYGAQFSSLTNDLAGGAQESIKWNNAEELLNIENVENPLRREAGLTERGSHQPPAWLLAKVAPLRIKWGKQLGEAANAYKPYQLSGPEEYDDWHRVFDLVVRHVNPQDLLDPARVKVFDAEVDKIWKPVAKKLGKRPKLTLANSSGS